MKCETTDGKECDAETEQKKGWRWATAELWHKRERISLLIVWMKSCTWFLFFVRSQSAVLCVGSGGKGDYAFCRIPARLLTYVRLNWPQRNLSICHIMIIATYYLGIKPPLRSLDLHPFTMCSHSEWARSILCPKWIIEDYSVKPFPISPAPALAPS